MINNNKNAANSGYSVRNPRYTWVLRLGALLFSVLFIFQNPELTQGEERNGVQKWATSFIASNNLDQASIAKKAATSSLYASSESREEIKEKKTPSTKWSASAVETRNKKSQKTVSKLHKSSGESNVNSTKDNNFNNSIKNNELKSITSSKNARLQSANAVANTAPITSITLANIYRTQSQIFRQLPIAQEEVPRWIIGAQVGILALNSEVSSPSSSNYAELTQLNHITSNLKGTKQLATQNTWVMAVNVGYALSADWELHTGVGFTQYSGYHEGFYGSEVTKTQPITTSTPSANGSVGGNTATTTNNVKYINYFSDTVTSHYRLSTLEIPLLVKYNIGHQKLRYFISTGVSTTFANYYSGNYDSQQFGTGQIQETNYGLNSVHLILQGGVSLSVTPHTRVYVAPGYRKGFVLKSANFIQNNSNLGVFAGFNYYF